MEKMSKEFEEGVYGSITCADRLPASIGSVEISWYYRLSGAGQFVIKPDERNYMDGEGQDLFYMSHII